MTDLELITELWVMVRIEVIVVIFIMLFASLIGNFVLLGKLQKIKGLQHA